MLRCNIWVSHGIVNRAMGMVTKIKVTRSSEIKKLRNENYLAVLIPFDDDWKQNEK